jgi:hypothetical protein
MEDLPKRLPEKLKQIRERTRLLPDDFAPHVKAKDGDAIIGYENGADIPVSVLLHYARLQNVPVGNLLDDDRDLLFGHLRAI